MGYTVVVRKTCFTGVLVWAILAVTPVIAQSASPLGAATPTPSPAVTQTITSTVESAAVSVTPTLSPTVAVTAVVAETALLPTPSPDAPPADSGPLEGTIVANRGQSTARFFVEGGMYELLAGRSQVVPLSRPTTVLNLYNCPAATPESQAGCFWDPYLIQQDGFYELYSPDDAADATKILLREAGAPPTNQVWVQNRTGNTESIVFHSDIFEMPPTTVLEFPVATGVPAILYVRNCLALDGQQVCEWAPRTLDAGVYYALVEITTPGSEPGAQVITIDLRPVVADESVTDEAVTAAITDGGVPVSSTPAPSGVVCRLAVPALNIRSGPGLQYEIVGKIRTSDTEAATVVVTGRSADSQWLTVDPSLASEGWITADPNFVSCDNAVTSLPIVESVAVVPAPEPTVVAIAPAPVSPEAAPEAAAPTEPEAAPTPEPQVPEGYALLVVHNGFEYEMRFTVDQSFRPFDGPSEYDIQPGEGVNIAVFPGQIAFTASSGWNGLSQNADLTVDADQSIDMWLRFERDAGGSWVLLWQ